ncbi:MAG: Gfo/Idh/MocA family protein [Christensenellales bacterium]|jgi:predicted dehydrogenase
MARVGILGFAHGHVNAFGMEWVKDPSYNVEVVCGWDGDEERAVKNCEQFGIKRMNSAEDVLKADIDSVVIAAETAYHAKLAIMAAEAGKNIVLYKPMALRLHEADAIVEAVNKHGVRFTMGWQMRVDPQNIKIKEMIQSNELGDTMLFRRRHGLPPAEPSQAGKWWHVIPEMNRDIFADDSSHPINLMQWIFGMPETVSCEMATMYTPLIPNDNGVALFKYKNGMIAEISCSFTNRASEISTEVYTRNGSIQQYYGDLPSTMVPRDESLPGLKWFRVGDTSWTLSDIPSPKGQGDRIRAQAGPLAHFLNGGPTICSAEEGRDSLRLVLACYLSVREGARVSVWDDRVYEI